MKKEIAEVSIKLIENKLENARLISLLSSISQSIKTNLH